MGGLTDHDLVKLLIISAVSENVFANNRLSIHLISSNPLSSFGLHVSAPFTFLSNPYSGSFKSTVLMSLSSHPYYSQKSSKIKNGVLRMLQIRPLLTNTVVPLTLSSNITKGCVVFDSDLILRLNDLRQPLGELNLERALVWELQVRTLRTIQVASSMVYLHLMKLINSLLLLILISIPQNFPGKNWIAELLFVMLVAESGT